MLANRIIMALKGLLIDHSVPVTVVASAYDTSGNGGRKLVRLSNGWLVAAVFDSATPRLNFYKSIDNGASWSRLCYANYTMTQGFAIASYGTNVYCIWVQSSNPSIYGVKFDATAVADSAQAYNITIDSSQTSLGTGCSITCDSSGNLYAAWCSKNATYPNSFNIRYSKSVDGGVTWPAASQIGTYNTVGADETNPSLVINSLGNPCIFTKYGQPSNSDYRIRRCLFTGVSWNNGTVYSGDSNRVQSEPSAVVSPDGTIHVVWYGVDSIDTTKTNIRYSKSTDGGANWSAAIKLTSGNTYSQSLPTITSDKNNNIYVIWQGSTATNPTFSNIRKIVYNGSWEGITELTSQNSAFIRWASLCSNYTDFTDPLCIYQDNQAGAVKFRGVWNEAA
jgi:hypothetical protein